MNKAINSSELADRVGKVLGLGAEDIRGLYGELSQVPDGPIKDAMDALLGKLEKPGSAPVKYVACMRGEWGDAVRRPAVAPGFSPLLYLETVEAATPSRAAQIAAVHAGVDAGDVELFPIK